MCIELHSCCKAVCTVCAFSKCPRGLLFFVALGNCSFSVQNLKAVARCGLNPQGRDKVPQYNGMDSHVVQLRVWTQNNLCYTFFFFFFSIRTAERLNFYCYQKSCWLFPVVVNDGSVCRAVKKSKVELTLSCSTEANTTVQADLA